MECPYLSSRIRTGTCSSLEPEQFLPAFILGGEGGKLFKIFRFFFFKLFLILNLFSCFIFFLECGFVGVLFQRGMILLIQISFIMEVTSLLNISGYKLCI